MRAVPGNLPDQAFEDDLEYIEGKTGGERLACRSDIVPSEIVDILPEIVFVTPIYDAENQICDVSIKLEGTKLVSFYGEHTGSNVGKGFDPEITMRIVAAVSSCVETSEPVMAELILHSASQRTVVVRSLYVPLSEDGENIESCFVHFRIQYAAINLAN